MTQETIKGLMSLALDIADRLIERAYGTDVPAEWNKAYRAVAKANAKAIVALASDPPPFRGEATFEAACAYADTSTDPLATMLRDAWTRLQGEKPDVAGAYVALHGARLAQAYLALSPALVTPGEEDRAGGAG